MPDTPNPTPPPPPHLTSPYPPIGQAGPTVGGGSSTGGVSGLPDAPPKKRGSGDLATTSFDSLNDDSPALSPQAEKPHQVVNPKYQTLTREP